MKKLLAFVLCVSMVLGVAVSVGAADKDTQGVKVFELDIDKLFPEKEIGDTVTDFSAVKNAGFSISSDWVGTDNKLKSAMATAKIVSDGNNGKALEFTLKKGITKVTFPITYSSVFTEGNKYELNVRSKCKSASTVTSSKPHVRSAIVFDPYSSVASNNVQITFGSTVNAGAINSTAITSNDNWANATKKTFTIADMYYKADKADAGRTVKKTTRVVDLNKNFLAEDTFCVDYVNLIEYTGADVKFNIAEGAIVTTRGSEVADGETIKAMYDSATSFKVEASDNSKTLVVKANGQVIEPANGSYSLGTLTKETTVDVAYVSNEPAVEKTEILFVDYNGKPAVYVYSLISEFVPGENIGYGINLWKTEAPENSVKLAAMADNEGTPAVAQSGQAFVIKAYGDAITSDGSYTAKAYVGEDEGDAVTVSAN